MRSAEGVQMLLSAGLTWFLHVMSAHAPSSSSAPAPPGAQCVQAGGASVCGHACLTFNETARCAQTPLGTCVVWNGRIHCWDPPLLLASLPNGSVPVSMCENNFTQLACGYRCQAAQEKVACASTPYGICEANRGRVTCWDPALSLIWNTQGQLPRPRCVASGDQVACGYACESSFNQVACAQTPQGSCQVVNGVPSCWDPPLPPLVLTTP